MSNCTNNYVPEYVPRDLPWYERDGLMTWYDQAKYQYFLKNSDRHFKTTKGINFDIIRREAAGQKVPDELLKKYQTIENERSLNTLKVNGTNFYLAHSGLIEPTFSLTRK